MSKDWTYEELSDKYMLASTQNINLIKQISLMKRALEIYGNTEPIEIKQERFNSEPMSSYKTMADIGYLARETLRELEKMRKEQEEQIKILLEITKINEDQE